MQPDIEIYLKDASPEAVHKWLQEVFTRCSEWQKQGSVVSCQCDGFRVSWYQKAFGSWHSLLFSSANTPWPDDLACARTAFSALNVEIRCAPGGWQEADGEQDADRWIKVSAQGVQEFLWR